MSGSGVLRFDRENGGQLALIGALHEDQIIGTPQAVDRLIFGLAGGAEVTLARCLLQGNPGKSGWLEETWTPQVVLRGACLDADKLEFDHVYFEVDALLEWTDRGHIEPNYRDDEAHRFAGVAIQHDEVPAESIDLDDGGTLEIRFPWAVEGDSVRDFTVRQTCVVHRSWTHPQGLDDILTEVRLFRTSRSRLPRTDRVLRGTSGEDTANGPPPGEHALSPQ